MSQFRFKKSFASKRNLAKQKQFRFVSLQFCKTTKESFASFRFEASLCFAKKAYLSLQKFRFKKKLHFVLLCKFCFVSLKKRFFTVVSL